MSRESKHERWNNMSTDELRRIKDRMIQEKAFSPKSRRNYKYIEQILYNRKQAEKLLAPEEITSTRPPKDSTQMTNAQLSYYQWLNRSNQHG